MKVRGVLDRIEGDIAVIIAEEANLQFEIPVNELLESSRANDWFELVIENKQLVSIDVVYKERIGKEQRVDKLMNKIKGRDV